jgi:hypothetical protein
MTIGPPITGYVYLIRQDDLTKIGWSRTPERRLPEVADPERAEFLHLIPSASPSSIEAALHRRFAGQRVQGEWFRLTDEDLAMLIVLSQVDVPTDLPPALFALPPCKTTVKLSREFDALADQIKKDTARRQHEQKGQADE